MHFNTHCKHRKCILEFDGLIEIYLKNVYFKFIWMLGTVYIDICLEKKQIKVNIIDFCFSKLLEREEYKWMLFIEFCQLLFIYLWLLKC